MSLASLIDDNRNNPLDVVERLAAGHQWSFERAGDEVVSLCVSDYELRVGDPCNPRSASCQLHERLRQVDADDAFGAGGRGKRRRARPTADIEHDLVRAAPSPFQKGLGEGFELAVVSVSVGDEVRGFGSVPRLRLSFICWHWRLADVRAGHIMSPRHICRSARRQVLDLGTECRLARAL